MNSQIARRSNDAFFKPPREFKKRGPGGFPIGKRTKERAEANRDMNKQGIRRCEIRIEGVCVGTIMLTWAHPTKSRYIVTKKDWRTAARCCLPCHQHIEALSHKKMKAIVLAAIAKRKPND
jgi:hypothetical protein